MDQEPRGIKTDQGDKNELARSSKSPRSVCENGLTLADLRHGRDIRGNFGPSLAKTVHSAETKKADQNRGF